MIDYEICTQEETYDAYLIHPLSTDTVYCMIFAESDPSGDAKTTRTGTREYTTSTWINTLCLSDRRSPIFPKFRPFSTNTPRLQVRL